MKIVRLNLPFIKSRLVSGVGDLVDPLSIRQAFNSIADWSRRVGSQLNDQEPKVCQLRMSATQPVASGNTTVMVSFDTVDIDTHGWYDPNEPTRVTPNVPGWYRVYVLFQWQTDSDYIRQLVDVFFNGTIAPTSPIPRWEWSPANTPSPTGPLVSPLMFADGVDDYFEVRVFQTNTSAGASTMRARMLVEYVLGPQPT